MTTETEVYSNLQPHILLTKSSTHLSLSHSHIHAHTQRLGRGFCVGTLCCFKMLDVSFSSKDESGRCVCDLATSSLLRTYCSEKQLSPHSHTYTSPPQCEMLSCLHLEDAGLYSCYQRLFSLCLGLLSNHFAHTQLPVY